MSDRWWSVSMMQSRTMKWQFAMNKATRQEAIDYASILFKHALEDNAWVQIKILEQRK